MIDLKRYGADQDTISNLLSWEIRDFLNSGYVLVRKAQVECLPKTGSVNVYSDHNPPHFHLKIDDYDVVAQINDCKIIKGHLTGKQKKQLEDWFFNNQGKEKIITYWNKFNPENKILI